MKNQQGRKELEIKRDGEDSNPPEPGPAISIEQFTELLHQQALTGDICCRAHVSTHVIAAEEEEEFKILARRVWEATGSRFTSVWFLLDAIEPTANISHVEYLQ